MTQAEERFARLMQEINTTAIKGPLGKGFSLSRHVVSAATATLAVSLALAVGATTIASYGFGYAPRFQSAHILAPLAFFPALLAASRFGGRSAGWLCAMILMVVEAHWLPPRGAVWIDASFVPWYIEFLACMCATVLLCPRRRKPHATDKGVGQGKRLGVIRNRPPGIFALGQNLIK